MQAEPELIWTVTEVSDAGYTIVGVYTSLTRAREVVSRLADGGHLEDYRIEGHALDHGKDAPVPWQVSLARDGRHLDTLPFVGCACADDEVEYLRRSFIDGDGEAMSVIVFAATPGRAIRAAQRYHAWIVETARWSGGARLQPLDDSAVMAAVP